MEPLIWTSKGNLPVASLEYKAYWENTDNHLAFVEEYYLDGEQVKRSWNGIMKEALGMVTQQGNLNG